MKKGLFCALALLATACATAPKIAKVSMGMTRAEVITAIGPPVSVSAQGAAEYLNYRLSETPDDAFMGILRPYYVRLVNGKVESFGRAGDFDSTKEDTVKVKTEDARDTDPYEISESEYEREKAKLMK
jgi:hypothetical protein